MTTARSEDSWILLLVVSVLSTLLTVIAVAFCAYVCIRFCIHPSILHHRRRKWCRDGRSFRMHDGRCFEMVEMGPHVSSLLRCPHYSSQSRVNRTGTSEKLGYRDAAREESVPVLLPPQSWTPSPPFPKGSNPPRPQTRTHKHATVCPYSVCKNCPIDEDRPSGSNLQVHFCANELKGKLQELRKKPDRTPKHLFNHPTLTSTRRPVYFPPVNTPNSTILSQKETKRGLFINTQSESNSSVDILSPQEEIGRDTKTRENQLKTNILQDKITTSPNSLMELSHQRQPQIPIVVKLPNNKKNLGLSHYQRSSTFPLTRHEEVKIYEELDEGKMELPNSVIKIKAEQRNRRKTPKKVKKKTHSKVPVTVLLESPASDSSSELTTELNPKTYWRIYHHIPPEGDDQEKNEDSSSEDIIPSMSWDHLTPDPSPSHEKILAQDRILSHDRLRTHDKTITQDKNIAHEMIYSRERVLSQDRLFPHDKDNVHDRTLAQIAVDATKGRVTYHPNKNISSSQPNLHGRCNEACLVNNVHQAEQSKRMHNERVK